METMVCWMQIAKILNAYFLPGDRTTSLYPTITPVNSFGIIFNKCFGTAYALVPDVSYNQPGQPVPETYPAYKQN